MVQGKWSSNCQESLWQLPGVFACTPPLPWITQTTKTMTRPLPCAVETHALLSVTSCIYRVPVIFCTSLDFLFLLNLLCLDCCLVLPHVPPACGDISHHKQSTTENNTESKGRRAAVAGGAYEAEKGNASFYLRASRINFICRKELIVLDKAAIGVI